MGKVLIVFENVFILETFQLIESQALEVKALWCQHPEEEPYLIMTRR
jgi:hypothetical protein